MESTTIVVIPVVWLLSINGEYILTGSDVHCMLTSLQVIVLSVLLSAGNSV